ncbi:hypothetical protein THAOC_18248, partial [Thalassiosira oceanica]
TAERHAAADHVERGPIRQNPPRPGGGGAEPLRRRGDGDPVMGAEVERLEPVPDQVRRGEGRRAVRHERREDGVPRGPARGRAGGEGDRDGKEGHGAVGHVVRLLGVDVPGLAGGEAARCLVGRRHCGCVCGGKSERSTSLHATIRSIVRTRTRCVPSTTEDPLGSPRILCPLHSCEGHVGTGSASLSLEELARCGKTTKRHAACGKPSDEGPQRSPETHGRRGDGDDRRVLGPTNRQPQRQKARLGKYDPRGRMSASASS